MTAADTYDRLPDAVTDIFGAEATAAFAYDLLTVDVPATAWTDALETARDVLGCRYFDWLSAVDEPGTGFRVCAHVAALGEGTVRRLLVRTVVPHDAPTLPSAIGVYAGAAWHERETHEMFGIGFEGHPHLVPLLLPEGFEGHPLRKDFVLAARVAKAWPGAKEPGESEHGGPKRRTMLPPGVPDPNEWGPLKGQLPPAPARPARGARAAGDRPVVRRARSVSEGSAAQRPAETDPTPGAAAGSATDAAATPQAAPARRTRSASQGSASQTTGTPPPAPAGAGQGDARPSGAGQNAPSDAGQIAPSRADGPDEASVTEAPADAGVTGAPPKGPRGSRAVRSTDAPWHHARPAFDGDPEPGSSTAGNGAPGEGTPGEGTPEKRIPGEGSTAPGPKSASTTEPQPGSEPQPGAVTQSDAQTQPGAGPQPGAAERDSPNTAETPEQRQPEAPEPEAPEPGQRQLEEPQADSGSESEAPAPEPQDDTGPAPDPDPAPRTDRPAGGDTA
ncbi:NADH-quinone oxidoreductase subunit C [Streptomyces clavifer]|uniref:NADH-quinone oxidoreductase subunit C n=1 Tax=Streptomyces clavifer TaxID=68188 RepID=UPI00343C73C1